MGGEISTHGQLGLDGWVSEGGGCGWVVVVVVLIVVAVVIVHVNKGQSTSVAGKVVLDGGEDSKHGVLGVGWTGEGGWWVWIGGGRRRSG